MNLKEIKEMIGLMNDNGLVELEIEKEGMRIRLKKVSTPGEGLISSPILIESQKPPPTKDKESAQGLLKETTLKNVEIKAPMVGTFYRAPSPEAPAYVETGEVIEVGQVICIIEAMKLMNEIKAEIKGRILEILVDNAEPVEFGQVVFLVEPL